MYNDAGFRFAGETITGLVRKHNEDNFLIAVPAGRRAALAVVADGVGGHRHGEIVSNIGCRELGRAFCGCPEKELLKAGGAERFLADVIGTINRRVFKINYEEFSPHPMSSTLVAVLFVPGFAIMANVGDSRFYAVRKNGGVEQVSTDHTVANDDAFAFSGKRHLPLARNIISRSIGSSYNLRIEVKRITVEEGDRFFLCTDGVYRDLSESMIADILQKSASPQQTLNRIMRSVLLNGAHDNTTVVSVFTE